MELCLNLAWLLLALPAYWLWRRDTVPRTKRRGGAVKPLLALTCGLVLLFPVVSATDDLHAMRAEMEDSAVSKRAVRQAGGERASSSVNRLQGAAELAAGANWLPVLEVRLVEGSSDDFFLLSRPSVLRAGRAPPFSLLG